MDKKEKNRILKLHKEVLLEQKSSGGRGGTNTSSAGQYDGNAFTGKGILNTHGRGEDVGSLPIEVDITKGSKGLEFDPKIVFITEPGDDDIGIDVPIGDGEIPPGPPSLAYRDSREDEDEINRPLSLSCCKKCDNGMYTNKCFSFDSDGDEDCRFPTLEVCEDESDPKLPSMLDIFS